ncbi:MAG: asparagine synthase (glutamine-hydrolyzing), partial [Acidobacteriia bacterium]|nr:asparagine synthase (glutamine-hydrolyzing) [Terriglobia bacterium]
MCGIVGIIHTDGKPVDRVELARLTNTLSHRGPDGDGFHVDANVGLGHRRLAIIDLESGEQPLSNEDGTVWVVLNGEIYNFKELRETLASRGHLFRTKSDTEAIVHAYEEWGVDCLNHLRGMFAVALWDARRKRLLLARDRMGIKPLCYYRAPGIFAFASEMHAFRSLQDFHPTLDYEALDLYLHFQYIPAPSSIYREVRKLPPAHYLLLDAQGNVQGPVRYWQFEFRPNHRLKEKDWVERIDAGLRDAVRSHLVSDVPFGAFLSGGIDSSLVVAYMSELMQEPVRTFTIGFEDDEYDERPFARYVSETCKTDHHGEVV